MMNRMVDAAVDSAITFMLLEHNSHPIPKG